MRIPFLTRPNDKPEERSQPGGIDYTEALANALVERATGTDGTRVDANLTAAVEAASGIVARALSMATINPSNERTRALNAPTMALIGRELIRRGECLFILNVAQDGIQALPASHWDVQSPSPDPSVWWYRADVPAPNGTKTRTIRASEVLHFTWAVDPRQPWKGISPLDAGSDTTKMLGRLENSAGDEASIPSGYILPVHGTPEQGSEIERVIERSRARLKVVANHIQGWATAGGNTRKGGGSGNPVRIGPAPPSGMVDLRRDTALSVFGACGIPSELASNGEGTSAREAWRRFLHGTIQPIADQIAVECSAKLGTEITISFDRLFASDLSGRARAFQSMVGGGMSMDKAAGLAGLLESE